jgi:uncharacterized membrane protein
MKSIFFLLALLLVTSGGALARSDETANQLTNSSLQGLKPVVRIEKRGQRNYVVGTIVIDAKPEPIWEILVDYPNAPQVFRNLKRCEVVGQKGQVKFIRQLVETGSPIRFDYIVALKEEKPRLIEWSRASGSLKEVTGTWQLEPIHSGDQTKVTYSIFIDGGFFLPPWLLAPQLKGYMPVVLNSLRERVEAQTRKVSQTSVVGQVVVNFGHLQRWSS